MNRTFKYTISCDCRLPGQSSKVIFIKYFWRKKNLIFKSKGWFYSVIPTPIYCHIMYYYKKFCKKEKMIFLLCLKDALFCEKLRWLRKCVLRKSLKFSSHSNLLQRGFDRKIVKHCPDVVQKWSKTVLKMISTEVRKKIRKMLPFLLCLNEPVF